MVDETNCPFCNIVSGKDSEVREVFRNNEVVVFFPKDPATLGHCLAIPVRHVETFMELSNIEVDALMQAVSIISKSVEKALNPDGINLIQSNGSAATQTVPHVHFHIVPRWQDDDINDFWPKKTNFSKSEMNNTFTLLRSSVPCYLFSQDGDDRRQHLVFIQDIISRMSTLSSNTKNWFLPIITAIYGYAINNSNHLIVILGMVVTIVFAFLDSGYLVTERKYRRLYSKVVEHKFNRPYSLDYRNKEETRFALFLECCKSLFTWSIFTFYGVFIFVGVLIILSICFGLIP